MDAGVNKCKGCGIVFAEVNPNIDKCSGKKLFCELCLAQKNPRSQTEQKIKKRYFQIAALAAFFIVVIFIAVNWQKNKYDNIFEYVVGYGFSYLIIWGAASILLLPLLMMMKKPHKIRIEKEKEAYVEKIEEKKASRKKQSVR